MLQSDYDDISGQQFTVRVKKQEDGSFVASTPNAPELGTWTGSTQQQASRKANDALAAFAANGYKPPKPRK